MKAVVHVIAVIMIAFMTTVDAVEIKEWHGHANRFSERYFRRQLLRNKSGPASDGSTVEDQWGASIIDIEIGLIGV